MLAFLDSLVDEEVGQRGGTEKLRKFSWRKVISEA